MGKVNVVIIDATGNKEQKVGLPDDIKCGIIMVKLVEKIKLPSVGPDGNPISYKFIHKVTGRQLLESQTLGEAGIKDGDVLRLQPEITAGAFCVHCGMENAEENVFCQKCGKSMSEVTKSDIMSPKQAEFVPNNSKSDNVHNQFTMQLKKNVMLFPIIGMFSGILSFVFGLVLWAKDTGVRCYSESYGGDAYTGIQNAAADTASNVRELAEICKFGLAAILIILGVAIFCYFATKMSNSER